MVVAPGADALVTPRIRGELMIDRQELWESVREAYLAVASRPELKHAFPVGG